MAELHDAGIGGNVIISEDVITSITATAVSEVAGFAGFTVPANDRRLFKNQKEKSIRLSAEEGATDVDLYIRARHGYRLTDVAEQIQKSVSQALEEYASFEARSINVHITEIEFKNPKEAAKAEAAPAPQEEA